MEMHECPICGWALVLVWENTDKKRSKWWAGAYYCRHHGIIRGAGLIAAGRRTVRTWAPQCKDHGASSVFMINETNWMCTRCTRRFEMRGRKLITTSRPPMSGLPGSVMADRESIATEAVYYSA
jgi:hypothetical protein